MHVSISCLTTALAFAPRLINILHLMHLIVWNASFESESLINQLCCWNHRPDLTAAYLQMAACTLTNPKTFSLCCCRELRQLQSDVTCSTLSFVQVNIPICDFSRLWFIDKVFFFCLLLRATPSLWVLVALDTCLFTSCYILETFIQLNVQMKPFFLETLLKSFIFIRTMD